MIAAGDVGIVGAPRKASVQIGVSRFERCRLWPQRSEDNEMGRVTQTIHLQLDV